MHCALLFRMADVTDSMCGLRSMPFLQRHVWNVCWSRLDGVISGFPNTYASKVGKTSDASYKVCLADLLITCRSLFELQACFSSFMSMHCSSLLSPGCKKIGGVLRACVVPFAPALGALHPSAGSE